MKKILISLALVMTAVPALAQHWHHGHRYHNSIRHHGHYGHNNWVAPLIIGGVVGAVIANRPPVQPDTIVVHQYPPTVFAPQVNCTVWKEIVTPEGNVYRERTCTQ